MEHGIWNLVVTVLQHSLHIGLAGSINYLSINLYLEQTRIESSFYDDLMSITVQFNLSIERLVDPVGDVGSSEVFQLTIKEIGGALRYGSLTCTVFSYDEIERRSVPERNFSHNVTV